VRKPSEERARNGGRNWRRDNVRHDLRGVELVSIRTEREGGMQEGGEGSFRVVPTFQDTMPTSNPANVVASAGAVR